MSRRTSASRRRFLQWAGAGAAAILPAAAMAQNPGGSSPDPSAGQTPGGKKRPSHKYEDLLPEQFYEEQKRAPIAYFGCGAMEEHGLGNALGTDLYVAYETCLRAAEISGGIVFPPVPFAPAYWPGLSRQELRNPTKELFPPSLWTSGDLCKQIYVELLESLADLGFKACVAFAGHAPADALLQQIEKELGGRIGAMKFWGGGTVSILRDHLEDEAKKSPLGTGHGMMWETSLVMAIRPDWVDLPRARRIKESPLPSQLKDQPQEKLDFIATANAELGNRAINLAAERAAKLAREMLSATAPAQQ
jgi:creatinine amidohydrolase/Fe(II)-dependent formamide hydrolase-like protein